MDNTTRAHINVVNIVTTRAEQEILQMTGTRYRLMVLPVLDAEEGIYPEGMLNVVANALGMTMSDYFNPSREREYAELRMIGCKMLSTYFPSLSQKKITQLLGSKDHTMVIYYLRTAEERIASNDERFNIKHLQAIKAVTQWMAEEV